MTFSEHAEQNEWNGLNNKYSQKRFVNGAANTSKAQFQSYESVANFGGEKTDREHTWDGTNQFLTFRNAT